ncbi:MAG: hypothetical protein ACXVB9_13205 [Bdellovibrionota bacterium]
MFVAKASLLFGILVVAAPSFAADLECKEINSKGHKSRADAVIEFSVVQHKAGTHTTVDMTSQKNIWKAGSGYGKASACEVKFGDDGKAHVACVDDHNATITYDLDVSNNLLTGVDRAGAGQFDWDADTGTPSEDNPGDVGKRFDVTCSYK